MTSRNGPCTCGSSKQYKRCCGKENNGKGKEKTPFSSFNTLDLLQTISALTLIPENHGKNVRLEKLSREAIIKLNTSTKKVKIDEFSIFLNTHYAIDFDEDLPGNLFTEVVGFHGGDNLILPGISLSPAFTLNALLPSIFNWPDNRLNPYFKGNVSHAAHALLLISHSMHLKAGLYRYMPGNYKERAITIPNPEKLSALKKAVFFTTEEIDALFDPFKIDKNCLEIFTANVNNSDFKDRHIEESPLSDKPLLSVPGGWLVASPATLAHALITAIKLLSEEFDCVDELHNTYHAFLWNSTQMSLKRLNYTPIEIDSIPVPEHDYVKTFFGRFDDDKIAIIQYLSKSQDNKTPSFEELAKQRERLIGEIIALPGYSNYQFIDIVIPSPLSNDLMLMGIRNAYSQSLIISMDEFEVVAKSKKCSALSLWKFAIALDEQVPREMKFGLSFLDQYKAYKDNRDSFYFSDEGFDLSQWIPGQSQAFIEEARLRDDEHCMSIRVDGRLAKTFVIRKDKYSPVYLSLMDMHAQELQFAIEDLGPSVWVKPQMPEEMSPGAKHIFWEFTDTLAYWLWQLTADIKDLLSAIDEEYICFSFQLDDLDSFIEPDDSFVRDSDVYNKLNVTSSGDTIVLNIPKEIMAYFYGAENEGDRIIVRQLLYGINDALTKKSLKPFTEKEIEAIIEKNAPLGFKKKLIILHSRSNLLLDSRNLVNTRYVKEYDTSTIANSIAKLLGDKCPPVGEVVSIDDKKQLTKTIVLVGLLPLLKKKVAEYDNEELIKRLIGLNESLINDREHQKIKTPTRIACFVSEEQQIEDLRDTMSDISRTTIALRCLLEHVSAEPSKGTKIVSTAGIDELVAIMDAIINWGSIGDQLTFSLFDIRLGVLKTGRIGTQKTFFKETFDPYYHSKTKETVQDALNSFNQEFPIDVKDKKGGAVPGSLDTSFITEFGISFSRICAFIDLLADQGFQQDTPYAVMDKKALLTHAKTYHEPFTDDEFNCALDFLGLVNRGSVENIPRGEGYEGFDISPWRFNRRLSLMRRPLIICETNDASNPLIYWGARQVLVSRMNLADQCFNDRLKVKNNSPVKKVLGKLALKRGASLVVEVLKGFKLPHLIVDSEVTISTHGKLRHSSDIGDIDVLVIDLNEKVLYSLECKSFAPSRNIKEMIEECDKLIGSRSEKGLIEKHVNRDTWIKNNLKQIGLLYKQDLTSFTVKSFMVTREDMLYRYLTCIGTSLPFVTLYDLESKGFDCLK